MKLSFERINTLLAKALQVEPQRLKTSFRPATEKDFENVVEFRKTYFGDELPWDDRAYLRWRYNFSDSKSEARNIFWILEVGGDLLGVVGTEFLELVAGSEVKAAYHPLDILVKPELDGLGLGAWISLAINEKYEIILAIGANENSKSLFKKVYHPMPNSKAWKLMLKSKTFVSKHIKSPLLVTPISLFFDQLLSLRRLLSKRALLQNGIKINAIEHFPNEVDEWRMSGNHTPKVYRLRSAEFLNWRFVDNPRRNYEIIGLNFDGNLIAYFAYHFWSLPQQQGISASIDDFFWDSKGLEKSGLKYEDVLTMLIKRAVDESIRNDAIVVTISFYGKLIESALRSMGFIYRGEEEVFGVLVQNENLKNIIYDENAWLLTDADTHSENF